MPLPLIPVIADAVQIAVYAGAVGGSVAGYCESNPGPGCVNKRDIIDTASVPQMQIHARADTGPCNVPQYNFDLCHDQLNGTQVASSIPSQGVAQFDNVPAACMNLATVLVGSCSGSGPVVNPCGSACLKYTGLTDDQFRQLSSALKSE
ncbi:hypothetical protein F4779DRAFT_569972 [Xylariaceae sp. FL0662B]|nr:hypothetical protein F4779DRAFT_569972 [Xylariaceae sp. FL0662B]